MAGNTVQLVFAGDEGQLTRAFKNIGSASDTMETKVSANAKQASGAFDRLGGAADSSEGKFMGMADVLDGLGGAFGLPTEKATGLMRAFGDLSGGFAMIQPLIGTLGASFKSLGMALITPPAGIILLVAALAAGFVIAYQKSETFRDIVHGVFDFLRGVVADFVSLVTLQFDFIVSAAATAFGWIPGIGPKLKAANTAFDNFRDDAIAAIRGTDEAAQGFVGTLENIEPKLDKLRETGAVMGVTRGRRPPPRQYGGPVTAGLPYLVGERGPELFVPGTTGTVVPRAGATLNVTINAGVVTPTLARDIAGLLRQEINRSGPLGIS